jgi:cytoskeletal protein CcmA (bactofilin family)
MFRRQESRTSSAAAEAAGGGAGERARVTHIAPGSLVRGELSGAAELLIDGRVEGEVRVEATVVVGAEGEVIGPLRGRNVRIGGRVTGRVEAAERVELLPSGVVEGDIAAPRIVIAEGAFFKGQVEMHGQVEDGSAAPERGPNGG